MHLFCSLTGARIEQLIAEPVDNKLYFTTKSRVDTYDLDSDVTTTVVNTEGRTYGLVVDRNSR